MKKGVNFSDHYAILIEFRGIPKRKKANAVRKEDPIIWNTNKKGGWEKYFQKSSDNVKLERA